MSSPLAGQRLREIREQLGLTLNEVEDQSRQIAQERQNPDYLFTAGRLSQVENSDSLPSLYKLATLSEIYQVAYEELLRVYGIDPELPPQASDSDSAEQEAGVDSEVPEE